MVEPPLCLHRCDNSTCFIEICNRIFWVNQAAIFSLNPSLHYKCLVFNTFFFLNSPALKLTSIGLKSGEYTGINFKIQPAASWNPGLCVNTRGTDPWIQMPFVILHICISNSCQVGVHSNHLGSGSLQGATIECEQYKYSMGEKNTQNVTNKMLWSCYDHGRGMPTQGSSGLLDYEGALYTTQE